MPLFDDIKKGAARAMAQRLRAWAVSLHAEEPPPPATGEEPSAPDEVDEALADWVEKVRRGAPWLLEPEPLGGQWLAPPASPRSAPAEIPTGSPAPGAQLERPAERQVARNPVPIEQPGARTQAAAAPPQRAPELPPS